ncbi:MAG TPA: inositol monophosphatase family protein [Solirubrobacteraceae bacterium]|nr:inositol monophosphatase family protein [Solirubrobacteraceae bacterium]
MSGRSDQQRLLALAEQLAREAGGLLLERFERGTEPALASKSTPTDLVSEADLASERLIRERLAIARPDDAFLGEESGGEDGSSGLTWVVDPLDGTVNFLFGVPQWCVSVAVRDERGELAGAVFDPSRDELFCATRDGAALLNGEVLRAPVDRCEGLSKALVATGFAYDASVRALQAEVLARLLPRVRDIRRCGSAALDLAWTAAGRYDAYFERTVKPWDIAAGVLVCERSGLAVRELVEREGLPGGVLVAAAKIVDLLVGQVG